MYKAMSWPNFPATAEPYAKRIYEVVTETVRIFDEHAKVMRREHVYKSYVHKADTQHIDKAQEIYKELLIRTFKSKDKSKDSREHTTPVLDGMYEWIESPITRKYKRINSEMSFSEGARILLRRMGSYPRKAYEDMKQRSCIITHRNNGDLSLLLPRDPISFSVLYEDILHASYSELCYIKLGNRLLRDRIKRAFIAGIIDSVWPDGRAGDFIDRKALDESTASKILEVQQEVWKAVNAEKAWGQLKVRIERFSNLFLRIFGESCLSAVRGFAREICKKKGLRATIRGFMSLISFCADWTDVWGKRVRSVKQWQSVGKRYSAARRTRLIISFLICRTHEDSLIEGLYRRKAKRFKRKVQIRNENPYLPCGHARLVDEKPKEPTVRTIRNDTIR